MKSGITFIAALCAVIFVGCAKDDVRNNESRTPVTLTSNIATRASGTTWAAGDSIGVFMKTAGQPLSATSIVGGADNRRYTSTAGAGATFSPFAANQTIYYPQSGSVDLIAYYPWRPTPETTPYIYKVNVAVQSAPAAIDLMWSNDAVSKTISPSPVAMTFTHMLSKLELTVVNDAGFTPVQFAAMSIGIQGMPLTSDFSLVNGTFSAQGVTTTVFAPRTVTAGSAYDAILVPQTGGTGRAVVFTIAGNTFTWAIPDATAFAPATRNSYTVTVSNTEVTVSSGTVTVWTGTGTQTPGTATIIP